MIFRFPQSSHSIAALCIVVLAFAIGCQTSRTRRARAPIFAGTKKLDAAKNPDVKQVSFDDETASITAIEPAIGDLPDAVSLDTADPVRPRANLTDIPKEQLPLTLEEAVAIAFVDTKILRSLSADVVRNSQSALSTFDPAIQGTDANFGVQAALAQFDSTVTGSALYANNDDFFNNPVTTGNAFEVQQDLTTLNFAWNRVGMSGTQFSVNQLLRHDNTDNPSVLFPSSWEHQLEATVRQPLMQGRGRLFNEIAGPNSRPGFLGSTGIRLARANYEISVGNFERGVRDLVLEIVNAYWQLDLAFRNYDTIKSARDASYETWQIAKARFENGLPGGEADREAQARSQYYQFEAQLDRALNASTDGGSPGVLQAEANLRRLLNLPQSDGQFIRPADDPATVGTLIDWNQIAQRALAQRVEIRQQQSRIQQAELTLIASRNFLLPRLDAIGTYRNSGLGDDLINDGGKFAGALNEAWSSNYDEWEFGFTFEAPVGFRQAKTGVKNAELQVAREHAVLTEINQQVLHELGTAYRDAEQSARRIHLAKLRRDAARDTVQAREAAYEADTVGFEDLLQAQQQLLEAELALHTAKTERERAWSRIYAESGSLLNEFQITTF